MGFFGTKYAVFRDMRAVNAFLVLFCFSTSVFGGAGQANRTHWYATGGAFDDDLADDINEPPSSPIFSGLEASGENMGIMVDNGFSLPRRTQRRKVRGGRALACAGLLAFMSAPSNQHYHIAPSSTFGAD